MYCSDLVRLPADGSTSRGMSRDEVSSRLASGRTSTNSFIPVAQDCKEESPSKKKPRREDLPRRRFVNPDASGQERRRLHGELLRSLRYEKWRKFRSQAD